MSLFLKKSVPKEEIFLMEKSLTVEERKAIPSKDFGIPSKRKYPLHNKSHVRTAISFFRYCPEDEKKELASNIIKKAKKYKINIREKSAINKYIK
jgi:hypothetical protein